jgi:hypothetical protein
VPVLGSELKIQIRPNGGYHIVINFDGSARVRAYDSVNGGTLSSAGGELTVNGPSFTNAYFHLICIATGATSADVEWHLVYLLLNNTRFSVTVT